MKISNARWFISNVSESVNPRLFLTLTLKKLETLSLASLSLSKICKMIEIKAKMIEKIQISVRLRWNEP